MTIGEGKNRQTNIMYLTNLNYETVKERLGYLMNAGLIKEQVDKSGRTYHLTEKGFILRAYYVEIERLLAIGNITLPFPIL